MGGGGPNLECSLMARRVQLAHHLLIFPFERKPRDLIRDVEHRAERLVADELVEGFPVIGGRRRPFGEVGLWVGVDFGDPGPEPGAVDLQGREERSTAR